ncbi:ARF GTPase-activating protein GIT2 [Exaiptasia diaphana]|uniref:Arf-GAP domain-containing protein n=1 Tax=Exaiptasia diaphana TaxID=2652724 RepID=A0A913WTF6_EXADI|nr:ARF GTPase-activating protein GIT2 [Exaiptasia diaphana]KXJ27899.1 ARF GTPase-activating protein GIT2 [Exaiptasia diaphana]
MSSRVKLRASTDICADCSAPGPEWASLNRCVLICDECCSVHRSLGRHVSQVKHLRHSVWHPNLLTMVIQLVNNGANAIWEHNYAPPSLDHGQNRGGIRKPNPKDNVHPTKSNFIKAKYQSLQFVHRLPSKDDDATTVDYTLQLHSCVRTSNLETSLRLLSNGAQPNYIHPEKGNTPLHIATSAGQALQVELLVVHGADPTVLDMNGKSLMDYALEAGHRDLAQRLFEMQYVLTDRLAFYLCGRKPDHSAGIRYLIPTMADSCLDLSQDAQKAKLKLKALSNHLFEELAADVYDEVDRRECDAIWLANQNHSALVNDTTTVPFLPVNPAFTSTRNQGRQKLALFNAQELATLILDVLNDARRREQDSNPDLAHAGIVDSTMFPIEEDRHMSHDYDEVASDDETAAQNDQILRAQKRSTEKSTSTSFVLEDTIPMENYLELKRVLASAEARIQQLLQVNASMSQGIQELQAVVQSLRRDKYNLQKQLGLDDKSLEDNVFSFDTGHEYINADILRTMTNTNTADDDDDEDHVDINDITPYACPGELMKKKGQGHNLPVGTSHSPNDSKGKKVNPYDNVPDEEPEKSEDERPFVHNDKNGLSDNQIDEEAERVLSEAEGIVQAAAREFEPSQEDVVRCTEQITKKIQELLLAAQAGRHSSFIPCSNKINSAVNDMATLFPENPDADAVRVSLQLMANSASRLSVECKSAVLPGNTVDMAFLTQQVIQCAYDIAKAAKQLVTTFSVE